jgi:hypothetical protein
MVMPDDVWVYECATAGTALSTAALALPVPLWRRVRADQGVEKQEVIFLSVVR